MSLPSVPTNFQITPTGIVPVGSPTFDQWYSETAWAIALHVTLPIVIGDLLVYGQMHWPEKFAQIFDAFETRWDMQTLRNYMSIARNVPAQVRQPLSIRHLDAVRNLPVERQGKLLTAAREQHMTSDDLRRAVRAMDGVVEPRRARFSCRRVVTQFRGSVKDVIAEDVDPTSEMGQLPTGSADVRVDESWEA